MQVQNSNPTFQSAADINLRYIVKNHAKHLPQRVLERAEELCKSGKENLPALYELHADIYKPLFQTNTLKEAKIIYPEFSEVIDLPQLQVKRSKALDAIKERMNLEDFSLDLLQKLYKPTFLETLVKEYGMTNRSLITWLIDKLQIPKLSSPYLKLFMMSNETENSRIAQASREALLRDPEAQQRRLQKAAETHKTQEYREKKRQEMIDFYKRNPEVAAQTSMISKMTWNRCPEIKNALKIYAQEASPIVRSILSKRHYAKLTVAEQRILKGYYKGFWDSNPNFKRIYKEVRMQVIKELGLQK